MTQNQEAMQTIVNQPRSANAATQLQKLMHNEGQQIHVGCFCKSSNIDAVYNAVIKYLEGNE